MLSNVSITADCVISHNIHNHVLCSGTTFMCIFYGKTEVGIQLAIYINNNLRFLIIRSDSKQLHTTLYSISLNKINKISFLADIEKVTCILIILFSTA